MTFFQKLKDRMFKSASKIDQGIETILAEAPESPPPVADTGNVDAASVPQAPPRCRIARCRKNGKTAYVGALDWTVCTPRPAAGIR